MSTPFGTPQSGALNGASPPFDAWDRPLPRDESADEHARAVLQLYHEAAAGLDGVFAMVIIDKRAKVLVQRFAIGDVAGMAAEAVARGDRPMCISELPFFAKTLHRANAAPQRHRCSIGIGHRRRPRQWHVRCPSVGHRCVD